MKLRRFSAIAGAVALTIGAVGATSAASVTPTFHEGNITASGTYAADCPDGSEALEIAGGALSGTLGGVTVNVTYHADNSIDFSATGGTVAVAFVKGGEAYNEYAYSPSVTSDTNLVSPENGGLNVPVVSHTVFCVEVDEQKTDPPTEEPTEEPSTPPTEEPTEEPSTPPTEEPTEEPTTTPTGGVEAETDVPGDPTAPPTDVAGGTTNGSTDLLPILFLVFGAIGLGAVALTPARPRR